MPTNTDYVAAVPTPNAAVPALLRAALVARAPYVLTAADTPTDLVAVDPATGAVIKALIWNGFIFVYDAADTTTAHDGETCLVSSDGKRYKIAGTFAAPYSALSRVTQLPADTGSGDVYVVPAAPTGDGVGHALDIAVDTARGWIFIEPRTGQTINIEDESDSIYRFTSGGIWDKGLGGASLGAGDVAPSNLLVPAAFIVENQTTDTPPSPADGTQYIVGGSPTGDWAGHTGKIAVRVDGAWSILTPAEGWQAYDKALNAAYRHNGTSWIADRGAWVGFGYTKTTSGSTTNAGTGNYTYSSGTAPATSTTHTRDDGGVTYTAKTASAILRVSYSARAATSAGAGGVRYNVALLRDGESNAIEWMEIVAVNATEMPIDVFFIVGADASEHTYKIAVFPPGGGASISALTKRTLTIEEAAS